LKSAIALVDGIEVIVSDDKRIIEDNNNSTNLNLSVYLLNIFQYFF